jgi:iron complex outermembrane receptor protein
LRISAFILPVVAIVSLSAQQAPAQRESVVVTGTYDPLTLEEIDRAIRVLPVRTQSLVMNSLVDVLRLDPSLDLASRAPNGVQADLSIRGSSFGQTLILLNGERLSDPQSGHHNMDIPVPVESVDRIEVMRGSGSALYGSDAVAGVVNIITAPPETSEFRLRTAVGSDGINQERVSAALAGKKLSEQLSFSRDFSSGFRPDRDYRNLDFASTTRLVSGLGVGTLNLGYMDHPFGADQFYGNFNSWEDTKTWFASVQQAIGLNTTASFAYRRHSDLFVLYRDQPDVFANHHSDESWQAALRRRHEIGATSTLFYGVEGVHESIVSNNLGNHDRSRVAAYGAVDVRAWKRFSLTLAAREELYRKWSAAFTPSVAAGMWLSPVLKLRASVSRAFRVPSYTELYYHDPANMGSPDLRPERAWSYEGGLDWVPNQRIRGELTIFERRERDGIDYYRPTDTSIYRALNIQNLNFRGIEASVRYTLSRTHTFDLRYTDLHGQQDTIPVGLTKYTFNYPVNSGVFAWSVTPRGNFLLRTRVGALERKERDPYVLCEIYAAMPHGRVHPFVQVSNVANTSYAEVQGVVMPGRQILGGIELVLRKR